MFLLDSEKIKGIVRRFRPDYTNFSEKSEPYQIRREQARKIFNELDPYVLRDEGTGTAIMGLKLSMWEEFEKELEVD